MPNGTTRFNTLLPNVYCWCTVFQILRVVSAKLRFQWLKESEREPEQLTPSASFSQSPWWPVNKRGGERGGKLDRFTRDPPTKCFPLTIPPFDESWNKSKLPANPAVPRLSLMPKKPLSLSQMSPKLLDKRAKREFSFIARYARYYFKMWLLRAIFKH